MDIQNHFYGHSEVLAAYAGIGRVRHIAGLVQHGWTVASPVSVHFADFPDVGARRTDRSLFVWSHESRAWDPAAEYHHTVPIGSPFLYLESLLGDQRPPASGRPVFIPFHGTKLVRVEGDHRGLAAEVGRVNGRSTVCLHIDDVDDPRIVDAWQSAGHHIVTAGHRMDPRFLLRIMHLVSTAPVVSSNRLSTAIVYAASAGTEISVFGDPLTFAAREATSLAEIRGRWPEFHEPLSLEARRKLARAELGDTALLTPDELRRTLGWDDRHRIGPAVDYWLRAPLGKAGKIIGISRRSEEGSTNLPEAGFSPLRWLRHPLSHLPQRLPAQLPQPLRPLEPIPVS